MNNFYTEFTSKTNLFEKIEVLKRIFIKEIEDIFDPDEGITLMDTSFWHTLSYFEKQNVRMYLDRLTPDSFNPEHLEGANYLMASIYPEHPTLGKGYNVPLSPDNVYLQKIAQLKQDNAFSDEIMDIPDETQIESFRHILPIEPRVLRGPEVSIFVHDLYDVLEQFILAQHDNIFPEPLSGKTISELTGLDISELTHRELDDPKYKDGQKTIEQFKAFYDLLDERYKEYIANQICEKIQNDPHKYSTHHITHSVVGRLMQSILKHMEHEQRVSCPIDLSFVFDLDVIYNLESEKNQNQKKQRDNKNLYQKDNEAPSF